MTHKFVLAQGQEYVEQYRLQYQREDEGRWFTFHNRRGQQVTQGYITKLTYFIGFRPGYVEVSHLGWAFQIFTSAVVEVIRVNLHTEYYGTIYRLN